MDPTVTFAFFWFTSMIVSDMLYMAKRPIVSTIVFLIPCVIGTVGIGVFVVEVLKIENGVQ